MIDAMDKAAGLSEDDALFTARRFRPEFVQGAEACRLSVLQPANDQGLGRDLRLALARRMAALPRGAQITKRLLRLRDRTGFAAYLALEAEAQAEAFQTRDFAEGSAAFKEKRAAVFRGE